MKLSLGNAPHPLPLASAAVELPTAGHKNSPFGPVAGSAAATPCAALNPPTIVRKKVASRRMSQGEKLHVG